MRSKIIFFVVLFPVLFLQGGTSFAKKIPKTLSTSNSLPGILPLQKTEVRLKKEDLKIKVLSDGLHLDIRANYTLSSENPATVTFGIPFHWIRCPNYWSCKDPSNLTLFAKKFAKTIKIKLMGESVPCRIKGIKQDKEKSHEVLGWCVGELEIPQGEEIPLTLNYQARFDYDFLKDDRIETSGDPEVHNLEYSVLPGIYWGKKIDEIKVSLDFHHFRELLEVKEPKEVELRGKEIEWTFKDVSEQNIPKIKLQVTNEGFLRFLEVAAWNRSHKIAFKAIASSELTSAGYITHTADQAIDGRTETAWCEGERGEGIEEWIKIQYRTDESREKHQRCVLQGFGIIPGFARDPQMFKARGKITKLEVKNCSDPKMGYKMVKINPPRDYQQSAIFVRPVKLKENPPNLSSQDIDQTDCFIFKIKKTVPGEIGKHSCITEIAPVLECN